MSKFGDNLKWFLLDIENADDEQIECGEIDIYGETEEGADCSCIVNISELCGAALDRIKELEEENARMLKLMEGETFNDLTTKIMCAATRENLKLEMKVKPRSQ